jgi:hypothetical protein
MLTHGLTNANPMPRKKKPPSRSLMGVPKISQLGEPYVHRNQLFYCCKPDAKKKLSLTRAVTSEGKLRVIAYPVAPGGIETLPLVNLPQGRWRLQPWYCSSVKVGT